MLLEVKGLKASLKIKGPLQPTAEEMITIENHYGKNKIFNTDFLMMVKGAILKIAKKWEKHFNTWKEGSFNVNETFIVNNRNRKRELSQRYLQER